MDTKDFNLFEFKRCKEDECTNKVTNIFGRDICRVFGKLHCENCENRSSKYKCGFWMIDSPNGEMEFSSKQPIKSSLGYLYGYPTKITYKEPLFIRNQGTTSRRWPRYKW